MRSKIKNICWIAFGFIILMLLPIFWANKKPTEVNFPAISAQDITAGEEAQQRAAKTAAINTMRRKVFQCEADDDCIIVDKDPCGCLVGPSGVIAINASHTLEFNQLYQKNETSSCPDGAPSNVKECSAAARAVCHEKTCKIVY